MSHIINFVHASPPQSSMAVYTYGVLKAVATMKTDCQLERAWGNVSMLKSLQKQSENSYIHLRIDFFRMAISSLLASMCRRHFWYTRYRVPPLQPGSITECLLSPRLSIRLYLSSNDWCLTLYGNCSVYSSTVNVL